MKKESDTSVDATVGHSEMNDVVTVDGLQCAYPQLFTERQLNWLLKSRNKNGLEAAGAIIKVGRRLYIKKSVFISWFLNNQGGEH